MTVVRTRIRFAELRATDVIVYPGRGIDPDPVIAVGSVPGTDQFVRPLIAGPGLWSGGRRRAVAELGVRHVTDWAWVERDPAVLLDLADTARGG